MFPVAVARSLSDGFKRLQIGVLKLFARTTTYKFSAQTPKGIVEQRKMRRELVTAKQSLSRGGGQMSVYRSSFHKNGGFLTRRPMRLINTEPSMYRDITSRRFLQVGYGDPQVPTFVQRPSTLPDTTITLQAHHTTFLNIARCHTMRKVVWCGSGVGVVCPVFGRRLAPVGHRRVMCNAPCSVKAKLNSGIV